MKKLTYFTLVVAIICGVPVPRVAAVDPPAVSGQILISEIQTAGASDATEEFVELYNPGEEPVDITGWQLQYRAASGTSGQSWPASSTKATIGCVPGSPSGCTVSINPKMRLVLVHTIANIADALPMTGGFSGSGGQIRLIQPGNAPVVHDFVGYGTAQDAESAPAVAPAAGKSLKRNVSEANELIDTQNNVQDFTADCGVPNPGLADINPLPTVASCLAQVTEPPAEEDPPVENPTPTPEEPEVPETPIYLPVLITEILPDPASPQQDSADEFIELYNPNDTILNLAGYQLQTGNNFRYHYTLGDTPLGPQRYLAIPSAVSKLSLANSGSGVRLIDPAGNIVFEVPNYGPAKEGQSWINQEGAWLWTLSPTPSAVNMLTLPPPPKPAAAAPKKKQAAKASTSTPKTVKAPAAKKSTTEPVLNTVATAKPQEPPYWVIVPLALLVVGYAIYEYRQVLGKAWQKTRGLFSKNSQDKTE